MDGLQVRLFGELSIQQDGHPIHFPSGKALELLCYLLVHRDRAHNREALSEVLWPGAKPDSSKRYLRQALWRLNATVPGGPECHRMRNRLLLSVEPDWVRINPEAIVWLDVSGFERAYSMVRDTPGYVLSDRQARDLDNAVELYRGDLLVTWCRDWCSYERERLQVVYLSMLDQLMGYCEAQRLYTKGLSLGQLGLRHDPVRERTHRQLMRLHYAAGDRTAAIRQYERCASILARELGIGPSAGTEALYQQVCADRVLDISVPHQAPPVADRSVPEWPDNAVLAELHARLDQIQHGLRALHDSVQQLRGVRVEPVRAGQNGSAKSVGQHRRP